MHKCDLRNFDYRHVGEIDADMWRAYYNHKFLRLFKLLFLLIKKQLGFNWWITLRLAYYSAWAAADYRINRKKVNRTRVLNNLTKFYQLVSKNSIVPFNYKKVAALELEWWDVHRGSKENNIKLEQSIAAAAAEMYNINPTRLNEYARLRAEAMMLPKHQSDSSKNNTDWETIKGMTIKSWGALHSEVQNKEPTT